jgi:hypothetical protein
VKVSADRSCRDAMRRNLRYIYDLRCFYKEVLRMPDPRRVWKADEIVKLKAMAGKEPGERIAVELGRTLAAGA